MRYSLINVRSLGAVFTVTVAAACGGGGSVPTYQPQQAPQSELTQEQRRAVRDIMHLFQGTGPNAVNVLSGFSKFKSEGLVEAAVDGSLYNVQQTDFDLTTAWPENDDAGTFNGRGWQNFDEIVHTPVLNGTVEQSLETSRDEDVHQQLEDFSAGTITQTIAHTQESNVENHVEDGDLHEFNVGSDATYTQTAWNQQQTTVSLSGNDSAGNPVVGGPRNETFEYQSWPVRTATVASNSTCNIQSITADTILSFTGWDTVNSSKSTCDASGTYTVYKPEEVAENTTGPTPAATSNNTSGTVTTFSSTVTSVDKGNGPCTDPSDAGQSTQCGEPATTTVGAQNELEQTTITTTTSTINQVTNTDFTVCSPAILIADGLPGDLQSFSSEVHTSIKRTYAQAPGKADAVRQERSFEKFFDHVETTRTVTTYAVTCTTGAGTTAGSYNVERTVEVHKSTTNPNDLSPSDLGNWLSTKNVDTEQFQADNTSGMMLTTFTDHGTEILTARLVEQATYAWTLSGSTTTATTVRFRMFGDDFDNHEQNTESNTTYDNVTFDIDGNAVTLSGTIGTRDAVQSVDGNAHSLATGHHGTLSVTLGDVSATVSGPEFNESIKP